MSVHWWMAAIFLGLLISGKFMAGVEGRDSLRNLVFDLHKSFGVLVLLLLGWRIYLTSESLESKISPTSAEINRQMVYASYTTWTVISPDVSGTIKRLLVV
jgi:cytochrome b561